MFTGILAAELLVKNAVTALPLRHVNSRGYGFLLVWRKTRSGLVTNITVSMDATRMRSTFSQQTTVPRMLEG
jgi:hypothetical protein